MALIVSIETSTKVCSVALHNDENLLAVKELHLDKSHSEHLLIMIKELLSSCALQMSSIDAVAFSCGPGSYTGLRIGSSTAKGLCYALGVPLISVPTLQAMAKQIKGASSETLLCPMLDARRMEVYAALYNDENKCVEPEHPLLIDENTFEQILENNSIMIFGSGMEKCKSVISSKAMFIEGVFPTAVTVGQIAFEKFCDNQFEDVAYFEPFYLKEFRPTTPKIKLV